MNLGCSGFLYSLVTGSQFIESGTHKKVVVVGADKMSSIVDFEDRNNCVLFGDGGGAVLLEPSLDENGIIDHILKDFTFSYYSLPKLGLLLFIAKLLPIPKIFVKTPS